MIFSADMIPPPAPAHTKKRVAAPGEESGAAGLYLLVDEIPNLEAQPYEYLLLEPHDSVARCWVIESFDPDWKSKILKTMVTVFELPNLYTIAAEHGYEVAFWDDPTPVFDWLASLDADPGVEIESVLEGTVDRAGKVIHTVGGFLPFQAQAVNFAKSCEKTIYCRHDTGMGKTVVAEGILLSREWDVCLYCVKPRNMTSAWRKLKNHTGIEATIIKGSRDRRRRLWQSGGSIFIFNAEKFKEDLEAIQGLVTDNNVLVIIDEMPKKYSHRTSELYKKTAEALYASYVTLHKNTKREKKVFYPKEGSERAAQMFGVALSATPIIHSPEGFFNQIRIFDPSIYGSVKDFEKRFVRSKDPWGKIARWKNLELMGAMAAHVVHYADKNDPAVINQFPAKLPPETREVDLDDKAQALYDRLLAEYEKTLKDKESALSQRELLSAIECFQLLCDNPRAVLHSAKQFEEYAQARDLLLESMEHRGCTDRKIDDALREFDKRHKQGSEVAWKLWVITKDDDQFTDRDAKGNCTVSKLLELRDILDNHDGKAIVFTAYNELMIPFISEWLDKWGISHVQYHGGMTTATSDKMHALFRESPDIKVFLSTDAGQDSIDLPEASLTVHYDLPRSWARADMVQRDNRKDRIDSKLAVVRSITLVVPGTVEDRKLEVMENKHRLSEEFLGKIEEQATGLARGDLLWVLTGKEAED